MRSLLATASTPLFLQMTRTHRITVILSQCTITDHKQLDIFKQPGACPETITLITVDLIKCLPDIDAPTLQLNMHHRQTVNQYRHIITTGPPALCCILINNLQAVIVDMPLIKQINVLTSTIIPFENLNIIFLNARGLFEHTIILTGNRCRKKTRPFGIRK